MATDILRIGIIGAGANTRSRHIPGLRMQNSVEIVGVANRSAESSQKAAKELDIPKAYGDWTEIIADKTIDAVCIGTWPYTHAEMTIAALDAGSTFICTGSPNRLPGDVFQFWPSHWSMCSQTVWPSARANFV